MRRSEGVKKINDSLCSIGLDGLALNIDRSLATVKSTSEIMESFVLAVETYSQEEKNRRTAQLLKRSKVPSIEYYSDLWDYEARRFDYEQLEYILELPFVREKRNLVIDGPSGTGKSWFASVIATKACEQGLRTRWVNFPQLIRDLDNKLEMKGTAFDSRLKYYTNFELLVIDEFLNLNPEQLVASSYVLQEFCNKVKERKIPMVITAQLATEKMERLFVPEAIGESIKGRILGNSVFLHLCGPNLNFYKPGDENL